jgi:ArsR family transcriptional regulator, lead/cadmium/zinc/bismuth-responsive transcriptional repressor
MKSLIRNPQSAFTPHSATRDPQFTGRPPAFLRYTEHMSTHSHVQRSYGHLKARLLDEASVTDLAETFKVLGDTTRVRILDALARAEVPVCDLASLLGLTQSAVSHQLRLLRSMRLVKSRRDGRHIYYMADDQHITALFEQGLEHVQERAPALAQRAAAEVAPASVNATARLAAPRARTRPSAGRARPAPATSARRA